MEYLLKLSGGSANDDDCDKVAVCVDDDEIVDICRINELPRRAFLLLRPGGIAASCPLSCRCCNDRLVKNELFANADISILCCGLEFINFDGYEETEEIMIRKKMMTRVMMISY